MSPTELNRILNVAQQKACMGQLRDAEKILEFLLKVEKANFLALALLAQIREALGDYTAAIASYDEAIRVNPGHALPFTRRSILLARKSLAPLGQPRRRNPSRQFVTMRALGANGRFGNQLLQYGFLRLYAARVDAEAVAPDWIGRDLYGLDDPLLDAEVRPSADIGEDEVMAVVTGRRSGRVNVDLLGYFCSSAASWSTEREQFRSFFLHKGKVAEIVASCVEALRNRGRTIVAIHIRRGDFGGDKYWIAPTLWYLDCIRELWPLLDHPVLYVATDDPKCVADFRGYSPVVADDLAPPTPGVEFLRDHAILREADIVATSNSTFSVTAALLNITASRFFRPCIRQSKLIEFIPWASPILL